MGQGGVVGGHLPYCGDDAGVMGGDVYDGEEAETAAEWEGCVSRVNDYRARCIASAVSGGLRVGFVASGRRCEEEFEALTESGLFPGATVRRAYGRQSITDPEGGRVRFFRSTRAVRGATLDVVYLCTGSDELDLTDVVPSLVGSSVGELVLC